MQSRILFPLMAMLAVLTTSSMAVMVVAVLAPVAAPEIGVAATRIGTYTAIVYLVATLAGAVTGPLTNRYGAIRVCQITMLLAALAMAALSQATLAWALVSALVLGCAYGPFNPASAHVLWRLSTARWRPFVFSVKQTGVPLGGALAGALIPPLVVTASWQAGALAVAALALLMAALLELLRSRVDTPRDEPLRLDPRLLVAPVGLALGDARLRRYTLTAFAYAGAQLSVAAFLVVYLTQSLSMSLVTAGSVFAAVQIGGFSGRLLWGAVAARLVGPRPVLAAIGLLTAVCLTLTAAADASWSLTSLVLLAGVLGASSFGWNGVILSEIASQAPPGMAAEATAGMQVVMFGGITVFPPTFGLVVTQTQTFTWAWLGIAALAVVGALLLARVPRS